MAREDRDGSGTEMGFMALVSFRAHISILSCFSESSDRRIALIFCGSGHAGGAYTEAVGDVKTETVDG